MIEIKNLQKSFGKLKILKEINLQFSAGEVVAIMGPNGSGKSTLLKSIVGLVIPDHGEIFVKGQSIKQNWQYRRDIGYMPQIARYPENLKVKELLDMIKDIRVGKYDYDEELLEHLKIFRMYDKTMGTLSGGMKQRVNAVIAFLFNQDIIILDEPTASLDPLSAEFIKNKIICEKSKGKLVIVTSHIISEVEEIADKIVFMMDGHTHIDSTIQDLKTITNEMRLSKAISRIMEEYRDE